MNRTLPWLICLLHASVMVAQSQVSGTYDDIAIKIAHGDRSAIYEAGRLDDSRLIPILFKAIQLHYQADRPIAADFLESQTRSLNGETISGAAHLALAKLGVVGEQRAVFCELYSANLDIESYALDVKLPYIGGWFQINSLAGLLTDNDDKRSFARGDVVYSGPIQSAVYLLRRLLPDGPAPEGPEGLAFGGLLTVREDALKWRQWIENHKERLIHMKPTGSYSYQDCPVEPVLHGIINAGTGKPISNARLEIEWDTPNANARDQGGLKFTLFSTQEGTYYEALPPGPYRVCIHENGYFSECRKIRLENGQDFIVDFSLTMDKEYNGAALQFLRDNKRGSKEADREMVRKAFDALSHDSSNTMALIGLLDFESSERGERVDQYPAIGALSVIDMPAVPYLVHTIREDEDELIRTNAAHALALIQHHCQQDIAALLETEASKPDISSEQQTRLRVAKAYVISAYPPCEAAVVDQQ